MRPQRGSIDIRHRNTQPASDNVINAIMPNSSPDCVASFTVSWNHPNMQKYVYSKRLKNGQVRYLQGLGNQDVYAYTKQA